MSKINGRTDTSALRSDIAALQENLDALVKQLKSAEGENWVDHQVDELRRVLEPVIEATKAQGEKTAAMARETVESHPFSSVLVAFVGGALAALLLSRR
ncbi:MAG: hypothetical protein AB7M05_18535 [Alphaproteobacteria bacterium]